ncbi:hypothetical protein [Micromonospora sp. RV43]|uniref:hypothetical protein n=1 Tax=Micromonospora sp. RV43 TaxID=1661387 RepID=UPI00064BEC61|nr:hypothetical protein [Micromonospora sp. RV43]
MIATTSQPTAPEKTAYGMRDGFDYDGFRFNADFPIPAAYVVVQGVAYFQGPDGFLWFAPDAGGDTPWIIAWGYPQNVAEFDARYGDESRDDPRHLALMQALCEAVDGIGQVAAQSLAWHRRHRS